MSERRVRLQEPPWLRPRLAPGNCLLQRHHGHVAKRLDPRPSQSCEMSASAEPAREIFAENADVGALGALALQFECVWPGRDKLESAYIDSPGGALHFHAPSRQLV